VNTSILMHFGFQESIVLVPCGEHGPTNVGKTYNGFGVNYWFFLASDFFTKFWPHNFQKEYTIANSFSFGRNVNCLGIFFSWIIFCHISTQFLVLGQKKFSFLQFQQFSTNLLALNVKCFFDDHEWCYIRKLSFLN
jgi:hypothetical protein